MNLRCPNCGGQVVFDPKLAKVICKFCGCEIIEDDFSILEGRQEYDKENEKENEVPLVMRGMEEQPDTELMPDEDEYMEASIYHCTTCGAELMLTGTEASTFCSFCGSSAIVFERVSKEVRPKWILPFKLTQEQALQSIKRHFSMGDYIPSKIKTLSVDKVHAIYMPYWLFDTYMRRCMVIEARSGNDGTYEYLRDASCRFEKMTLDASLRLNNEMSRRLEPFPMEELTEFDVAYLSGYYADRYDVTKEALKSKNVCRCREYLNEAILDSCPEVNKRKVGSISNYVIKDVIEEYQIKKAEYALLPAYFVNIKYGTGKELVLVNGQTGKVVANLPYEKKQIIKKFFKNALIACPLFMAAAYVCLISGKFLIMSIPLAITGFMVAGGISGYKKYKMGRYRMSSANMTSYTNEREDVI